MYKIADLRLEIWDFLNNSEFRHERFDSFQSEEGKTDISYEIRLEDDVDITGYEEIPANINRTLYQSKSGWLLIRPDKDLYPYAVRTSPEWNSAIVSITPESLLFLRKHYGTEQFGRVKQHFLFQAIMENFRFSVIAFGGIYLHGVCMQYNGKAILLSAPSQTGKSTHAALWERYENVEIVNGDNCVLRKEGDHYMACGLPWCGSSNIYINKRLPLGAIVFLEQSEENKAFKISAQEAFMRCLRRSFCPEWDFNLMNKVTATITDIVSRHDAYVLRCRPDKEAVEVLKQCMNLGKTRPFPETHGFR